jgi:hypothetical protein
LLLAIIAISLLSSGPFIMDPPGVRTLHGTLHGILGGGVSLMPINCFCVLAPLPRRARVARASSETRSTCRYSSVEVANS